MALFDSIRLGSSAAGDYEIERSLRFNDDDTAYLERNVTSSSNRKTHTFSAWIKRCEFGDYHLIYTQGDNAGNEQFYMFFNNNDQIEMQQYDYPTNQGQLKTTQKFRDPSAWYHIVMRVDTTNSTADDRFRIYVNGEQVTSFETRTNPSQDLDTWINDTTYNFRIGATGFNGMKMDGYMTEINFIDGLSLAPSSFAETDALTGEYKAKKYAGSYGTNGFYLNFSDNSGTTATTLGKDSSGNGNNFTPNNFVTGDAVKDSPTNNFCVLNINDNNLSESSPHFVYSEGNLKASWSFTGTNFDRVFGSLFIESSDTNKYYWEATGTQNNEQMVWGVIATDTAMYRANNRNTGVSAEANVALLRWASYTSAPYLLKIDQGSATEGDALSTSNGNAANNDIFSFVFDGGTGKFYVWFKGVELSGQNYSAGTSVFDTVSTTKTYALMNYEGDGGGSTKSGSFTLNFGQDSSFAGAKTAQGNTDANGKGDFYYAVPTGAKALCSANIPDPTILLPNKHFETLLYTGNGSGQTLSGLNFSPDWLWIKSRSSTEDHQLNDQVRGTLKSLSSDSTSAENTASGRIEAFTSDGFTVGNSGNVNSNSETFVAWNWNAGGSTVTNNDGSVASEVRANTSSGFSIVTFSGSGNRTIGHGLGVAPQVIIMKGRNVTDQWTVGHHKLDASNPWHKGIPLNTDASTQDNSGFWNDTAPTSTVFSKGTWDEGYNMVAYCFSEVAGYSKFGSYTPNQNDNGPFVYLGFKPRFLMIKATGQIYSGVNGNWYILDTARDTFNVATTTLAPNQNYADDTNWGANGIMDILSNGFKIRDDGLAFNSTTSSSFIYFAFAETPFKYSRAR